jgi:hypothetical protein
MTLQKCHSGVTEDCDSFIPASRQASLRIWMPAIHAGMTNGGFSSFVSERELMQHVAVKSACWFSSFGLRLAMLGQLRFAEARNRVVPHDFPHDVGLQ